MYCEVFVCKVVNYSSKSLYFLASCYVYLFDSAFNRILVNYNLICSLQFLIFFVLFSRILFFKLLFCFVAKAYGFCLQAQAVNSDFILNVLETVKFVFFLQIHALAKCIMNSKFCILRAV